MKKETAAELSRAMLDVSRILNDSVRMVLENEPDEELRKYRTTVGQLMGMMCFEVMNPIYKEYPDLEPPGFR